MTASYYTLHSLLVFLLDIITEGSITKLLGSGSESPQAMNKKKELRSGRIKMQAPYSAG